MGTVKHWNTTVSHANAYACFCKCKIHSVHIARYVLVANTNKTQNQIICTGEKLLEKKEKKEDSNNTQHTHMYFCTHINGIVEKKEMRNNEIIIKLMTDHDYGINLYVFMLMCVCLFAVLVRTYAHTPHTVSNTRLWWYFLLKHTNLL